MVVRRSLEPKVKVRILVPQPFTLTPEREVPMSTILIVDAQLKPESVDSAVAFFAEIAPDTRAFEGCEALDICIDSEDSGSLVLIEKWESMDHYHRYHKWREETGALDRIRSFLAGPPQRRVLNVAA